MKNLIIALICIATFAGCKKDKQADTTITANTILGKWDLTAYTNKLYRNDVFVQDIPLEYFNYQFEFLPNGKVLYYEGHITSDGEYSITRDGDKYIFFSGIQGRHGALDNGYGVIKMLSKTSIQLTFENVVGSQKYVFTETLVKM
ncbi:hypothetical protein [Mucilaginibacter pedocola]|uniref:Lipocalin-like domain-containing protein n=1 Tax=Mucilaginibacter pedocola TaxID=1792845 RepID=A0A1S9PBX0_9SPHI|nr:hypothetical protein [Mucilaginibacter pedocola]OOQ58484.1 hypothetical protein BC343_07385 [Mucilaginibacter pedocola]